MQILAPLAPIAVMLGVAWVSHGFSFKKMATCGFCKTFFSFTVVAYAGWVAYQLSS